MYVVTVAFEIAPGAMEAFLPLIGENARASLTGEPGCLRFDVCREEERDRVFLYEIYRDRAAFETHLASAHYQAFSRAVESMVAAKTVETWRLLGAEAP